MPLAIAADPVQSLIDKEKTVDESWSKTDDELPAAVFFGDNKTVEIYSPAASRGESNVICEPVAFDELAEIPHGQSDGDIELNTRIPRVREILEKQCLVRPGDALLAIGPNTRQTVHVNGFRLRAERTVCPTDQPYSLVLTFEEKISDDPFFYSTDEKIPAGVAEYRSFDTFVSTPPSPAILANLKKEIPLIQDFQVTSYAVGAKNIDALIVLHRAQLTLDDADLLSDAVYWSHGEKSGRLLGENVDPEKGTGHLSVVGLLDYNADGLVDVYLKGDHGGCPYYALFEGRDAGFENVPLPTKPCSC